MTTLVLQSQEPKPRNEVTRSRPCNQQLTELTHT